MKSSSELFKQGIDNAYKEIKPSNNTVMDANRYKRMFKEDEKLKGGKSDKMSLEDLVKKHSNRKNRESIKKQVLRQLKKGINIESEHTDDRKIAKEIAMDHIYEDMLYYDKLKNESLIRGKINPGVADKIVNGFKLEKPISKLFSIKKTETKEATSTTASGSFETLFSGEEPEKVEATEATSSTSVGGYQTTDIWAKSMDKKNWRGKSKTQIPGGSFVSVKKKCKKFPYCNQGDINSVNIFENESVNNAIKNVASKLNISEEVVKFIVKKELGK